MAQLTFKSWEDFSKTLIVTCYTWEATKDGVYYKTSKYGDLHFVSSKDFALFNVER